MTRASIDDEAWRADSDPIARIYAAADAADPLKLITVQAGDLRALVAEHRSAIVFKAPRTAAPLDEAVVERRDDFLRKLYAQAFNEGAESTIEQWQCDGSGPPTMPHKDCLNEGSHQFVEDHREELAALTLSPPTDNDVVRMREALSTEFGIVEGLLKSRQLHLRVGLAAKHEKARAALKEQP